MTKIVEKTKLVDVPEKGQLIFNGLKAKYSGQLLWDWAVYADKWLSDFMDNTMLNHKPPKAINKEIMGFYVNNGGKLSVKMNWKEPAK